MSPDPGPYGNEPTEAMIEAGAHALWEEHGTHPEDFDDSDERRAAWENTLRDAEAVLRAALNV